MSRLADHFEDSDKACHVRCMNCVNRPVTGAVERLYNIDNTRYEAFES